MPSAVNTASKEPMNWPARSPDQELDRSRVLAEVHQEVAGCLCHPRTVRVGGDAGQVDATGAVLDDDVGSVESERHEPAARTRPLPAKIPTEHGFCGLRRRSIPQNQSVDATEQHGVHVDEIDRENAAGLRGQELLPSRACTAGRGVDPGGMQDLPHRGSSDRVADLDEFALHATVSPGRVLVAMRITSLRIAAAVDGRSGRRWLV